MDLNMENLLFCDDECVPNHRRDNLGDTTLCLNGFTLGKNKKTSIGDSCTKELHALDDGCMVVLGLGPTPSSYCSNPCSLAANKTKEPVSQFERYVGNDVDTGILQLGLEPFKRVEQSNQSPPSYHRQFSPSHRLLPVVDEGSTNGGRYMPSLLLAPRLVNGNGGKGTLDTIPLQCQHQPSPDPSATTDCSMGSFSNPTAETAHDFRAQVHHPKKCRFRGCSKGARGASGLCIAHGGGQRCQKPGCTKGAESRTAFCKAHGGGRRCEKLGCTKSAEGKTDFCIAHGGGRRCGQSECTKAARGKSGLCIKHGGGKRCTVEGCTRSAEGQAGLCISHGGGRRCQFPGCDKGAQGSTMHCKAHGGGKRCIVEGCTKGAEGSTPLCKGHGGGKRCLHEGGGVCTKSVHGGTDYCVAHGGGKRCAVPGCSKSARGRTDCCVKHGGGKRCKFTGCGKSAQGSTDFCKAHGGGKRCSWAEGCDKFARGKSGLCAGHANKAAIQQGHEAGKSGSMIAPGLFHCLFSASTTAGSSVDNDYSSSGVSASSDSRVTVPFLIPPQVLVPLSMKTPCSSGERGGSKDKNSSRGFAVPEGRVHGGGLLSLLGGNFHNANAVGGGNASDDA